MSKILQYQALGLISTFISGIIIAKVCGFLTPNLLFLVTTAFIGFFSYALITDWERKLLKTKRRGVE